jgi:hypothetical protein
LNWEWWRATDRKIDWDQVKLEWVDVAHFLFSEIIIRNSLDVLENAIELGFNKEDPRNEISTDEIKADIKGFIQSVLMYEEVKNDEIAWPYADEEFLSTICWFLTVISDLALTMEQFYTLFIGKVCLNQLRWKNGYKKGIYNPTSAPDTRFYVKTWDGVEDNVWLSNHAVTLDVNAADFKDRLFADLEAKYQQIYAETWAKQKF